MYRFWFAQEYAVSLAAINAKSCIFAFFVKIAYAITIGKGGCCVNSQHRATGVLHTAYVFALRFWGTYRGHLRAVL